MARPSISHLYGAFYFKMKCPNQSTGSLGAGVLRAKALWLCSCPAQQVAGHRCCNHHAAAKVAYPSGKLPVCSCTKSFTAGKSKHNARLCCCESLCCAPNRRGCDARKARHQKPCSNKWRAKPSPLLESQSCDYWSCHAPAPPSLNALFYRAN